MTVARLEETDQPAFTAAGERLLGNLWDTSQAGYEARWLGPESPQRARGDLRLLVWTGGEGPEARMAIWLPSGGGESLFCLYARDAGLDAAVVAAFLAAVKAWCRGRGIAEITGPMQFSTWHPYRFISRMGDTDYFPGEQKLPENYHADFLAAGFADIGEYESTWVEDAASTMDTGVAKAIEARMRGLDLTVLAGRDLPALLPEIHRMSLEIFPGNFAYTPIALDEFLALAGDGKGADAVLVMARAGGRYAGFAYGYDIGSYRGRPDGPARKTASLKTVGVHPDFRRLGLGFGLAYRFHRYWLERGHEAILHAYMKTDNTSRDMSAKVVARSIRTYALMKGAT